MHSFSLQTPTLDVTFVLKRLPVQLHMSTNYPCKLEKPRQHCLWRYDWSSQLCTHLAVVKWKPEKRIQTWTSLDLNCTTRGLNTNCLIRGTLLRCSARANLIWLLSSETIELLLCRVMLKCFPHDERYLYPIRPSHSCKKVVGNKVNIVIIIRFRPIEKR